MRFRLDDKGHCAAQQGSHHNGVSGNVSASLRQPSNIGFGGAENPDTAWLAMLACDWKVVVLSLTSHNLLGS